MFYRFMLGVAHRLVFPFLRLFNRVEITGIDYIPEQGAFVLAANHLSFWDPVYLFCCVPRKLHFMAKAELFQVPVVGWVIAHVHGFPVHRNTIDRNALRIAAEVLAQGEALVLFPEGTRSRNGELLPFYDGAVLFAQRSEAVVVPVAIINTPKSFPAGFRQKVLLRFGEPIDFSEYQGKKVNSTILHQMTGQLRCRIKQLQEGNL